MISDCRFRIADCGFEKNKKGDAEAEIRGKESSSKKSLEKSFQQLLHAEFFSPV